MADDPQDRTPSHAANVKGLAYPENALDRAQPLREQFNTAVEDREQQQTGETDRSKSGAKDSSQKDHRERGSSAARIEAARKARETLKARQGKSHDREQDRDR